MPYPTLNLGSLHGGDASNRICACCELHMDIRPLPGMTLSDSGWLTERSAGTGQRALAGPSDGLRTASADSRLPMPA